jgi:hypothetical protein
MSKKSDNFVMASEIGQSSRKHNPDTCSICNRLKHYEDEKHSSSDSRIMHIHPLAFIKPRIEAGIKPPRIGAVASAE